MHKLYERSTDSILLSNFVSLISKLNHFLVLFFLHLLHIQFLLQLPLLPDLVLPTLPLLPENLNEPPLQPQLPLGLASLPLVQLDQVLLKRLVPDQHVDSALLLLQLMFDLPLKGANRAETRLHLRHLGGELRLVTQ